MKIDKFGQEVVYLYNGKTSKNNISLFVEEKQFDDYSAEGITSYLSFRHPIGDITMFKDYKKLPFGTQIKNGKQITFWHPQFGGCSDTFNDAVNSVDTLLKTAIDKLIKGKKKIGATISGGVDSSLIVAILRKHYPDIDIYSYSAGFYGDDEFEYSRLVAQENNTVHKEIVLGKNDFIGKDSILSKLVAFKGAPLHPNELPLALIEKIAKQDGCDIVLCGEGSDDIFGGYGQNFRMYLNYNAKEPFFKYFLNNYRYFSLEDRWIIKSKYFVDDLEMLYRFIYPWEMPNDIRNWAIYFTQKFHTPGLIARGSNAMRFNDLPLGFPYIDDALVDYANSLPFEFKLAWKTEEDRKKARKMPFRAVSEKHDIPKFIIKKVAERYLPSKIIYRPKKGFPVPFQKWLGELKEWDFDMNVFTSKDISKFNGWKKFMLINLDAFIKIFSHYRL